MTKRTKKILIISLVLTILVMLCCLAACGQTAVKTLTVKGETYYMVGEEYKDGDAKLTVVYTDGTRESVSVTEDMMKGFSTASAGTKTVVIEYKGKVATLEITVSELYASQIAVTSESVNRYFTEDTYTDGDAQIVVSYTDGTTQTVDVTESMISGFSTAVEGNVDVTVQYARLTTTYSVNVRHPLVTSATINASTRKLYELGDKFESVTVEVEYENGKSATIDVNGADVEGFDTTTTGEKTVYVTHRNWSDSFTVKVIKQVQSVSMQDYVKYYGENQEFQGATLKVNNKDGTSEDVDVTQDMIKEFDTSSLGKHVAKLAYGTNEVTFELCVVRSASMEVDVPYKIQVEDDSFVDLSGVSNYALVNTTTARWDITDDDGNVIVAQGAQYSNEADGYSLRFGNRAVTGTLYVRFYTEQAGAYHIGMRAQSLVNNGCNTTDLSQAVQMSINGIPTDITGTLQRGGATTTHAVDIRLWTELDDVSGTIYLKRGVNEIAFEHIGSVYPGFDYFTVTKEAVYENVSIEVTAENTTLDLGSEYAGDWTLTIKDNGEAVGTIPVTEEMLKGFDTSTAGEKTVTVSYLGATANVNVTVVNVPHTVTLVNGTFTATGLTTVDLYKGDAIPDITWTVADKDVFAYSVGGQLQSEYTGATMGSTDMTIEAVTTARGSVFGLMKSPYRVWGNSGINTSLNGVSGLSSDISITDAVTAVDVYGTGDGASYKLTGLPAGYLKGITWYGVQNTYASTGTEVYVTFTNNNDVTLEDVYYLTGATSQTVLYLGDVAPGETVKVMAVAYGSGNSNQRYNPSLCYANEMTTLNFTISIYLNNVG